MIRQDSVTPNVETINTKIYGLNYLHPVNTDDTKL